MFFNKSCPQTLATLQNLTSHRPKFPARTAKPRNLVWGTGIFRFDNQPLDSLLPVMLCCKLDAYTLTYSLLLARYTVRSRPSRFWRIMVFGVLLSIWTDGWTNGQKDGQMDRKTDPTTVTPAAHAH